VHVDNEGAIKLAYNGNHILNEKKIKALQISLPPELQIS
jgi:hypothetical protein